jgi:nitrite reductase/ring-hydroxylating ferredoxin subunit
MRKMTLPVLNPRYDIQPYSGGWFQIAWSNDVKLGEIRKIRQFGREYTLFRGSNGELGLLDDVCPHLGAHFSEGGCVVDNSVRCPYHHWHFDKSGECVRIPHAGKIPPKARVRSHSVEERYGLIFMYRDAEGGSATRELPSIPGFDQEDYFSPGRYEFTMRIHPQDVMENIVDSSHFYAVHGHGMPRFRFSESAGHPVVTQDITVPRFGLSLGVLLNFHLVEPGFHYTDLAKLPGASGGVLLASLVPVDEDYTTHRMSIFFRKGFPIVSRVARRFLLWEMMRTYKEDLRIWESKEYLSKPVLCDLDQGIMRLRRWYAGFLDPAARIPESVSGEN